MSAARSIQVVVPSFLVVPQRKPPAPPPMPGTVRPEDVRPPLDPPLPFIVPWSTHRDCPQGLQCAALPCDADAAVLEKYLHRHDVEGTLDAVFNDRADKGDMVAQCLRSLRSPFTAASGSDVVWTLVPAIRPNPSEDRQMAGKKLKSSSRHKILLGAPWSIASFADPDGAVRRNVVYDGNGDAVAQVDFGHGNMAGVHVHALVRGNLEHTPGSADDHSFPVECVPWPWLCVPDVKISCVADGPAQGNTSNGGSAISAFSMPATLEVKSGTWSWVSIRVPFEDYMGDRFSSSEAS